MNRNYQTPTVPTEWSVSRETHHAVAVAIHAISGRTRSPEAIWEAPTTTEWDHVQMAVEEYISHGDFQAEDDGRYPWGEEVVIGPASIAIPAP